jgi:hypothetical protein
MNEIMVLELILALTDWLIENIDHHTNISQANLERIIDDNRAKT